MTWFEQFGPWMRDIVRAELAKQTRRAVVTAKVGGNAVMVQQYGSTPEGPYRAQAGASGVLQVGDEVVLYDYESASPVVGLPIEGTTRRSTLSFAGADIAGGETTSVSDWDTLLDVPDLYIPAAAFSIFTFGVDIEVVGSTGAGDKQVRIVFNNEVAITTSLGTGDGGFFAAFILGPLPTWASIRSIEGINASWSSIAGVTSQQTITRVRIQARTQDASGDDIVRAENLIIYA